MIGEEVLRDLATYAPAQLLWLGGRCPKPLRVSTLIGAGLAAIDNRIGPMFTPTSSTQ